MKEFLERILSVHIFILIGVLFTLCIITLWRFDFNAFIMIKDFILDVNNIHTIRKGLVVIEALIVFICATANN